MHITQAEALHRFSYNKETGEIVWKSPLSKSSKKVGDPAGSVTANGRLQISVNINGRKLRYYAHQIIWLMVYGELPENSIEHINGNYLDNKLENLREYLNPKHDVLSQDLLKKLFIYNPDTGHFTRKGSVMGLASKEDMLAGHTHQKRGYHIILIDGKSYQAHKLAWLYMTGEFPEEGLEIDHKNNNRSDNTWSNLRLATKNQNNHNASLRYDSPIGIKGITIRAGSYIARIRNNTKLYEKSFNSLEEAKTWLDTKRKELHLDFANFG